MKYNMLTKQITLYIIIAVVGFIAVTTICFRHDYKTIILKCFTSRLTKLPAHLQKIHSRQNIFQT